MISCRPQRNCQVAGQREIFHQEAASWEGLDRSGKLRFYECSSGTWHSSLIATSRSGVIFRQSTSCYCVVICCSQPTWPIDLVIKDLIPPLPHSHHAHHYGTSQPFTYELVRFMGYVDVQNIYIVIVLVIVRIQYMYCSVGLVSVGWKPPWIP